MSTTVVYNTIAVGTTALVVMDEVRYTTHIRFNASRVNVSVLVSTIKRDLRSVFSESAVIEVSVNFSVVYPQRRLLQSGAQIIADVYVSVVDVASIDEPRKNVTDVTKGAVLDVDPTADVQVLASGITVVRLTVTHAQTTTPLADDGVAIVIPVAAVAAALGVVLVLCCVVRFCCTRRRISHPIMKHV